jgi:hypothetical protein
MRNRDLIVALLPVVAVTVVATAFGGGGNSEVSSLKQATAKYHDIETAKDAGYITELPQVEAPPYGGGTCIVDVSAPIDGAMGIHMVDTRDPAVGGRLDGTLVASEPEALLYERRNDGTLKLTGVEYIVAGGARPSLFGQLFDQTDLVRYGAPPETYVWTLHAWVWKPNPGGMFAQWNDRVSC